MNLINKFFYDHPTLSIFIQILLLPAIAMLIATQGYLVYGIILLAVSLVAVVYYMGSPILGAVALMYAAAGVTSIATYCEKQNIDIIPQIVTWDQIIIILCAGLCLVPFIYLCRNYSRLIVSDRLIFPVLSGLIGYWLSGNIMRACVVSTVVFFLITIHTSINWHRNARHMKDVSVLSVVDFVFLSMRFINGQGPNEYKYRYSMRMRKRPVPEKKELIRKRIEEFASLLPPDSYIIECDEALFHILKKSFPSNYRVIEKKLFRSRIPISHRDLEDMYDEDWREIARIREIYVWYMKLEVENRFASPEEEKTEETEQPDAQEKSY